MSSKLAHARKLYLPWAVLGELYYGAYRSANRRKTLSQVRAFLSATALLIPTERTIRMYGRIKSELAAAGTPIPENDIWIAALARERRLPLATRDAHFAHFAQVNGLIHPLLVNLDSLPRVPIALPPSSILYPPSSFRFFASYSFQNSAADWFFSQGNSSYQSR